MTGLVARLDSAFYPGESKTWDNVRFRTLLASRLSSADHVLDVGAGRGRIPEMDLRSVVSKVIGVDPDPCVLENPFLHEAVHTRDPEGPLPFEPISFDAVVTCNVLEHVHDPSMLFREVARVLKPGGLFISKTPNRWHYVAAIAALTPHAFHEWVNERRGRSGVDTYPTFYRANSRRAVRRLADSTGLEVLALESWEGPPNYLRIVPVLYPIGIGYERLVNTMGALAGLRAVIAAVLRKPGVAS